MRHILTILFGVVAFSCSSVYHMFALLQPLVPRGRSPDDPRGNDCFTFIVGIMAAAYLLLNATVEAIARVVG
jgi:hypothetical protein